MNRLLGLSSALFLVAGLLPSLCHAQPRLCFLTFDPGSSLRSNRYGDFFEALRTLGYQDGRTLRVDYLSAEGKSERFAELVGECIKRRVDVIVVSTTPAAMAAK